MKYLDELADEVVLARKAAGLPVYDKSVYAKWGRAQFEEELKRIRGTRVERFDVV